jgi:hypothetical protein
MIRISKITAGINWNMDLSLAQKWAKRKGSIKIYTNKSELSFHKPLYDIWNFLRWRYLYTAFTLEPSSLHHELHEATGIWGFHARENSGRGLLGCGRIPTFRRTNAASIFTLKTEAAKTSETSVSYHTLHYTASQLRRTQLTLYKSVCKQ